MDFLFGTKGLSYNTPALALLAYLLWKRPTMGTLLALMAGMRVFGPILGAGQWIPFSVHMAPVAVAATAYRNDDESRSLILFVGAVLVALITAYFYLSLWQHPTPYWRGALAGLLIGGASWLFRQGTYLIKKKRLRRRASSPSKSSVISS